MLDDDVTLRCLDLRHRGFGLRRIAALVGVSFSHVGTITDRVLAADLAESGEPEDVVRAAYWPKKTGGRHAGR